MKAEVIREIAGAYAESHSNQNWRYVFTTLTEALRILEQAGFAVVKTEELEAALKPFAAVIEYINEAAANSADEYDKPTHCWTGDSPVTVKLRDCTTAAALLAAITQETKNG